MINLINANTAAENWTCKSRHRHAKVDQVLALLGWSETLLKQTLIGSRVKTKENFADTGTRDDLKTEFVEGLQALEREHGWTASEVPVDAWLRAVGWDQVFQDLPERDWYALTVCPVHRLAGTHSPRSNKEAVPPFPDV